MGNFISVKRLRTYVLVWNKVSIKVPNRECKDRCWAVNLKYKPFKFTPVVFILCNLNYLAEEGGSLSACSVA
jgi:hypothetical protein